MLSQSWNSQGYALEKIMNQSVTHHDMELATKWLNAAMDTHYIGHRHPGIWCKLLNTIINNVNIEDQPLLATWLSAAMNYTVDLIEANEDIVVLEYGHTGLYDLLMTLVIKPTLMTKVLNNGLNMPKLIQALTIHGPDLDKDIAVSYGRNVTQFKDSIYMQCVYALANACIQGDFKPEKPEASYNVAWKMFITRSAHPEFNQLFDLHICQKLITALPWAFKEAVEHVLNEQISWMKKVHLFEMPIQDANPLNALEGLWELYMYEPSTHSLEDHPWLMAKQTWPKVCQLVEWHTSMYSDSNEARLALSSCAEAWILQQCAANLKRAVNGDTIGVFFE